ncbi:MAG: hypothetical protein K0R61_3033 [Microvirga sp.]|nr:hypothetical protein [Microvirga sp.]
MSATDLLAVGPAFWPSQYTAAMLHVLRLYAEGVRGACVLEIGCGSDVLFAAAGTLGAVALCGVDVEPAAVAATHRLLRGLAFNAELEVYRGERLMGRCANSTAGARRSAWRDGRAAAPARPRARPAGRCR